MHRTLAFVAAAAACQLSACSPPKTSLELDFAGQRLTSCAAVESLPLHDGAQPGGVKLSCKNPFWTLWVITDTRRLKDGRVNQIEFSPPLELPAELAKAIGQSEPGKSVAWLTAVHSTKLGTIELAKPCGRLTLKVERAG